MSYKSVKDLSLIHIYIQLSDMDGRTVVGSAFRSYTVDADGEIPQVAQLYLLSSQKLFPHACLLYTSRCV